MNGWGKTDGSLLWIIGKIPKGGSKLLLLAVAVAASVDFIVIVIVIASIHTHQEI